MTLCELQKNISNGSIIMFILISITIPLICLTVHLFKKTKEKNIKKVALYSSIVFSSIFSLITIIFGIGYLDWINKRTAVYDYVDNYKSTNVTSESKDFIQKYSKLVKLNKPFFTERNGKFFVEYEKNGTTIEPREIKDTIKIPNYEIRMLTKTLDSVKCKGVEFKIPRVIYKVNKPVCINSSEHTDHTNCTAFNNEEFSPKIGTYLDEETNIIYLLEERTFFQDMLKSYQNNK